jgi:hypothetical protein
MFAKKNVNESLYAVEMLLGDENTTVTNYCNAYC